ncbi:MAG: NAD(P)/FAD-dependent oxidoreductase [Pirellulales bacterium]|nr:NAD(P)/FAD-dependent oxidoreductase [Pirellulales bacterium]
MSATWDVIVIGAGAAGLFAATRAAERGFRVLLLEKNRKPGMKILMSGGTRCNLTQATDHSGIVEAFRGQGKFLHSALTAFAPENLIEWIEAEGVPTKVESTGKVFPASDRSMDVLVALSARLERSGAQLVLMEPVIGVAPVPSKDGFLIQTSRRKVAAAKVILTTGGKSYPDCGTSGDGYTWVVRMGHSIVPLRPALVPVTVRADWVKSLRGITVPDVAMSLYPARCGKFTSRNTLDAGRGSMIFTHFGLSGPVVLDISRSITSHPQPRSLALVCDFLPWITHESLKVRLRSYQKTDGTKQISALLAENMPRRLANTLMLQAGVPQDQRAAELGRDQLAGIVRVFKSMAIPVTGTLGFKKAEVTAGGVNLKEVDSRTMASKLVAGLFLAGEILDLDGPIGGYNFQAAFSTGWLAAESIEVN